MAKKKKNRKGNKNSSQTNASLISNTTSASSRSKSITNKGQVNDFDGKPQESDSKEIEWIRKCLILQIKSKIQAASYYRNWFKEQSVSIKILHQKAYISTKHYHQHLEKLGFDVFGSTSNELLRPSSSLSEVLKVQLKQLMARKQQLTIDLQQAEEEWSRLNELTNPQSMLALEKNIKELESIIQDEIEKYNGQVEILRTQHRVTMETTERAMLVKKKESIHTNIPLKGLSVLDTTIMTAHHRLKRELETVTKALTLHADEVDQLEKLCHELQEEGYMEYGPHMEVLGSKKALENKCINDGGQRFYV
ncbi:hypothetical protein HMI54_014557 [Coelomomyces lativittatus]|nr:hypothetical protein HMI56_006533 [Coelomomyces lativittatus]KAJ1514009.1 hypothetical protein HMI54_014557 [Coelomomyces lativittatus]KAJ1517861.1 hypothetical protein HMI55_005385 [Coelomomyces lativittatus]